MLKTRLSCLAAIFVMLGFLSNSAFAEEMHLLTWSGYAPQVLLDKFKSETGIDVKVTLSNNEEMIAKLRATRGAGFDLAQPSQDRISSVQEQFQLYQPIDLTKVKTDQIIPSMLDAVKNNTTVGGHFYAIPHCWGSSGLVVNKKYAPNAKDYSDILNAMYAGKISYRLKRPTLIALAFAMGENPFAKYSDAAAYEALMNRVGDAMIAGKPFVKNYWTNGDALLQSMLSEEVYVAMAWDKGGWKLHDENPNIDFVAPISGALGWIDTFAIPAKAKNVDGAYKWINFMLHPENAAVFTNLDKTANASAESLQFLEPAIRENFKRSFSVQEIANIKWYPPVSADIESIEGKILDKVKAAN